MKSEVIYFADAEAMAVHAAEWELDAVRRLATVTTAATAGLTLGVVTGEREAIEAQV